MAITTNKRSIIILYSGALDPYSHRVRLVLAEKGVSYEVINVDNPQQANDLLTLNPYGTLPTLVDRDLVLYEPNVITEYLDERFPHPPLMPVYPVARAKARLIIHRFDHEWGPLIQQLSRIPFDKKSSDSRAAAKELGNYLTQLIPIFQTGTYFMGDEFTLVDCCIVPILWRLSAWGVSIPSQAIQTLNKYTERIFQRNAFQASLTEMEEELQTVC